nr:hypothetical protein [Streptomyces genisteinicus]
MAGLSVLTCAGLYAGDSAGAWHVPWFVALPVVFGGLGLAACAGSLHYGVRRRRARRKASAEKRSAPASTSGSQAIR